MNTRLAKYNKGDIITDGKLVVLITHVTNSLYVFYSVGDIQFQDTQEVDMDPSIRLATQEEAVEWKARQI